MSAACIGRFPDGRSMGGSLQDSQKVAGLHARLCDPKTQTRLAMLSWIHDLCAFPFTFAWSPQADQQNCGLNAGNTTLGQEGSSVWLPERRVPNLMLPTHWQMWIVLGSTVL